MILLRKACHEHMTDKDYCMRPCKNLHVFWITTLRCITVSSKFLPLHQALSWHAAQHDYRQTPAGAYMSG